MVCVDLFPGNQEPSLAGVRRADPERQYLSLGPNLDLVLSLVWRLRPAVWDPFVDDDTGRQRNQRTANRGVYRAQFWNSEHTHGAVRQPDRAGSDRQQPAGLEGLHAPAPPETGAGCRLLQHLQHEREL